MTRDVDMLMTTGPRCTLSRKRTARASVNSSPIKRPCLVDEGQAIGVGVEDEADVGSALVHQRANARQVLGDRLRLVQEEAIGVAAVDDGPALQRFQQAPAERSAGAAVGVEEDFQPTRSECA